MILLGTGVWYITPPCAEVAQWYLPAGRQGALPRFGETDMYFVYIIQSCKDKGFYTGISSDPERRLKEHNKSDTKTTRSKKPWKLVYSEKFDSRIEARVREKFLKSGAGREFRDNLKPR